MKILLLLGESPASASARSYGIALAQKTSAKITALTGIDLSYIEAGTPGAIGGASWKFWLEQRLVRQADDIAKRAKEIFEHECAGTKVSYEFLSFEGDSLGTIQEAAETHDLILTGYDTSFHGRAREDLSKVISGLLFITPRPVIVCPEELFESNDILVSYDSSLPSIRSLQLFALFNTGRAGRVYVASIDADGEIAATRANRAVAYLNSNGYDAESAPIVSDKHVAEALRSEVLNKRIGTLVMGAYGHRGFRELLFGSTTTELVKSPPCPLFIYH